MNKSKITEYNYIDFLIGTQRVYSTQKRSESALMRKMVLRMMPIRASSTDLCRPLNGFGQRRASILI